MLHFLNSELFSKYCLLNQLMLLLYQQQKTFLIVVTKHKFVSNKYIYLMFCIWHIQLDVKSQFKAAGFNRSERWFEYYLILSSQHSSLIVSLPFVSMIWSKFWRSYISVEISKCRTDFQINLLYRIRDSHLYWLSRSFNFTESFKVKWYVYVKF